VISIQQNYEVECLGAATRCALKHSTSSGNRQTTRCLFLTPVPFERTATGTILVKEFVGESGNSLDLVAFYAGVSGSGQESDLEAQLGRISVFAATKKLRVVASIGEIGSGLNGHRPKRMKLLFLRSKRFSFRIETGVLARTVLNRLSRFGVVS
jgi:predicted site-specific integrase-resolvase